MVVLDVWLFGFCRLLAAWGLIGLCDFGVWDLLFSLVGFDCVGFGGLCTLLFFVGMVGWCVWRLLFCCVLA